MSARATQHTPVGMAALGLVRRFARLRRQALLAGALVAAVGLMLAAAALLAALDLAWPLPAAARSMLRVLPVLAALALMTAAALRVVRAPDVRTLALRAEEQDASLDGYLTTALDADTSTAVGAAFAERAVHRIESVHETLRVPPRARAAWRGAAAAAVALAVIVLFGGPARVWERWVRPADAHASAREGPAPDALPPEIRGPLRIEGIHWIITPPTYTGLPRREERDASVLEALPGSRIVLRASTSPGGVPLSGSVVGGPPLASATDGEWRAEWTLDPAHRGVALELETGGVVAARRVIPIRIREDAAPDVRLVEPAEDVVVGTATGTVRVVASAHDDFGVTQFHLSWIHTSGSGESFSFRQGEWFFDRVSRDGETLLGAFDLDIATTGMRPGDVLHVRAVAFDGNDVGGPGEGVSRTRVIRVARDDEMAEITTLIGFPLEAGLDPVLSQRMIILLTERLRDRAGQLARDALLHESNHIGDEQGRLRDEVGEEIYVRLSAEEEPDAQAGAHGHAHDHGLGRGRDSADVRTVPGGEEALRIARILEAASIATGRGTLEESMHFHDASPILSMNPLKLAAFNAMWAAERELRQGRPVESLPHQYEALDYIQRMREADRVFVRGRQTVAPIDVGAVRGTGRLSGASPAPRTRAHSSRVGFAHHADLDAALAAIGRRAAAELSVEMAGLALRILGDGAAYGDAAALVSRAAEALAGGDEAQARALALRARAALTPEGGAGDAPPLPGARSRASAAYLERIGGGS